MLDDTLKTFGKHEDRTRIKWHRSVQLLDYDENKDDAGTCMIDIPLSQLESIVFCLLAAACSIKSSLKLVLKLNLQVRLEALTH